MRKILLAIALSDSATTKALKNYKPHFGPPTLNEMAISQWLRDKARKDCEDRERESSRIDYERRIRCISHSQMHIQTGAPNNA